MEHMSQDKLSVEEKKLLKQKIHDVFDEFPIELKQRILDTMKEKISTLYMIKGWAEDNGHDDIVSLLIKRINHKEMKVDHLEKKING